MAPTTDMSAHDEKPHVKSKPRYFLNCGLFTCILLHVEHRLCSFPTPMKRKRKSLQMAKLEDDLNADLSEFEKANLTFHKE